MSWTPCAVPSCCSTGTGGMPNCMPRCGSMIDELEAGGDETGRRAWTRIMAAIGELSRVERRPGESLQ